MTAVLKVIWSRWKRIAHKIADVQARVLLSIFYFCVFGPFALGMKALSDPLQTRATNPSAWLPRVETDGDYAVLARRQF